MPIIAALQSELPCDVNKDQIITTLDSPLLSSVLSHGSLRDYPSKGQKGGSQRQKGMISVNFRQGRMV
ncbi:hypothetical protein DTO063F5_6179 [Paecilomyces variotii]|nr:hypothetical protein DTO063F5_6179 [Paecilomyces variotii]